MIILMFVLFLHLNVAVANAQTPSTWTKAEMNPMEPSAGEDDKKIEDISCGSSCKFDLHYFRGKNVSGGKNILYIPGGPGSIVDRKKRALMGLEDKNNIFYFDIRGAGFSAIDGSNGFDTALRAEHVAGDIERIRVKELGANGAWDAIYAHSHGTIIAQHYVNSTQSGGAPVKKLILSAPVSRFKEFEFDRVSVLRDNLKSIFENYRRPRVNQECPTNQPPAGDSPEKQTDNFCFLTLGIDGTAEKLAKKLNAVLLHLTKEFGSITFVVEHYDRLRKEEATRLRFPYSKKFYRALSTLSSRGGSEPKLLIAAEGARERKFNAAFFLGYYLALDENRDFEPGAVFNPEENACRPEAPFFDGVTNEEWKVIYCSRYLLAVDMLNRESSELESKRASYVYGINDGLNRFIFRILGVDASCVDSRVVKDFASATQATTHKVARAVVRRVGVDLDKPICLWNPGDQKHSTPTLILKGGSDPLIAGCQAEEVFDRGLTGERVLFEFPSVGHRMELPTFVRNNSKTHGNEALVKLVDTFLNKSFEQFIEDDGIKELKEGLSATVRTATTDGGINTCPN